MVSASTVLAEGDVMLRVDARYEIRTDDFEAMDRASDALMDALMDASEISDPDVAVSMTDRSLEIWLNVPTDDLMEALARGASVLAMGLDKAGLRTSDFTVTHTDDMGAVLEAVHVDATAVPA